MNREVWIWAEQRQGRLLPVCFELLGKGHELCQDLEGKLAAVLLGSAVAGLCPELMDYGCEKVYLAEDPRLSLYQADLYTDALSQLIDERRPEIVLWGATTTGTELSARVAARLKIGLTAHCIDLYIEDREGEPRLVQVVPGWSGNLAVKTISRTIPQMATVKPNLMARASQRKVEGDIIPIAVDIEEKDLRAETIETVEEEPEALPLEQAEIVVSGGWGLNAVGGFAPVEEIAAILGGAVAGTRPAFDRGWIPESRIIGISGKIVSPKLFISLGASGATQYTTGFARSQVILAVDQNPDAPIFEIADIGIVGDLQTILPLLIKELKGEA
ncbi:MAG: electron transfer flavoprotein subunit alpha/FixB family protein [Deltaproteobacteria bacterium]|nr:MAG: electron transfer flavoprotein subunit alpha/FixB family protein [Deltaproteobacteria bacterium]